MAEPLNYKVNIDTEEAAKAMARLEAARRSRTGARTTEFWALTLVVIGATALVLANKAEHLTAWATVVVPVVGTYIAGRSYVKGKETPK